MIEHRPGCWHDHYECALEVIRKIQHRHLPSRSRVCKEDGFPWPCPTAEIIGARR